MEYGAKEDPSDMQNQNRGKSQNRGMAASGLKSYE